MAELSVILNEVIISDKVGANYTSLNAAINAGVSIKTFRIESAITLTANVNFPANTTLLFGEEGSLSGAFTLTGNNTTIQFKGKKSGFATNISFAGTWDAEYVTPGMFGAVGDGSINNDGTPAGTNDSLAIANLFTFAALTSQKKIVFDNKIYRHTNTLNANGFTIESNGATLLNSGNPINVTGSISDYSDLSENAFEKQSWIRCDDAIFLATLSPGDVVKIISDEIIQPTSGENVPAGEMHIVRSIDTTNTIIYFNDYLFWDYKTADNARVAKVTMSSIKMRGLKLWDYAESGAGMSVQYAYVDIKDCFFKGYSWGLGVTDCMYPKISVIAYQNDPGSLGYGVTIGSACMYADIQIVVFSSHACFSTTAAVGISWGTRVHDSIAILPTRIDGGGFDTHASTGSITFDNCIVYGGIRNEYFDDITTWDNLTNYDVNDIVRSLTKEITYIATEANVGEDPDTDDRVNWGMFVGNLSTAYKAEGLNCFYNNCKCYDVNVGFYVYGNDTKKMHITNCECFNVASGTYSMLDIYTEEIVIDGLRVSNRTRSGSVVYLGAEIGRCVLRNIHGYNAYLLIWNAHFRDNENYLEVDGFTSEFEYGITDHYAISVGDLNVTKIRISNGRIRNCYLLYLATSAIEPDIDILAITNCSCITPTNHLIQIRHKVKNLLLNGIIATDPLDVYKLLYSIKDIVNLTLIGCVYYGTNATDIIEVTAGYAISYVLQNNNIFPNCSTFMTGAGALAAIEIMGGSLGASRILRGSGSPEGSITAGIGSMYLRSDGGASTSVYFKESGTGNTGWIAK